MNFNLNWFLGVLAIEFWIAAYLIVFWREIRAALPSSPGFLIHRQMRRGRPQ